MRATHSWSPTPGGGTTPTSAMSCRSSPRFALLELGHGGAVSVTSEPSAESAYEPQIALGTLNRGRPNRPLPLSLGADDDAAGAIPRREGGEHSQRVDYLGPAWLQGGNAFKLAWPIFASSSGSTSAVWQSTTEERQLVPKPAPPAPLTPAHLDPRHPSYGSSSQSRHWRRRRSLGRTSLSHRGFLPGTNLSSLPVCSEECCSDCVSSRGATIGIWLHQSFCLTLLGRQGGSRARLIIIVADLAPWCPLVTQTAKGHMPKPSALCGVRMSREQSSAFSQRWKFPSPNGVCNPPHNTRPC